MNVENMATRPSYLIKLCKFSRRNLSNYHFVEYFHSSRLFSQEKGGMLIRAAAK